MTQTTHLALPYLDAAQAQKHVTHNEALALIDALTQLSVSARNVTTPPATPAEGDRLLIGAGATGAFTGKSNQIATFLAGDWSFRAPQAGWRAYVEAEQLLLLYDGAAWIDCGLSVRQLQNLSLLGVGATADGANPLLAKLNAALFTAKYVANGGDGDLRLALNKESAAKTVSQLYQSNYSARAETGLIGDDNFHVKVSADGSTWKEAVVIDKTTGQPNFPQGLGDGTPVGFRNLLRNASLTVNQRAVSGTVSLAAGQFGHDGLRAGASGASYTFATVGVDTQITISAGSLIMPIEASMIEGGVYTLSQAGGAQARIWQGTGYAGAGSYAACPFQTSGLTANAQTNIEFSTGTILRPQFERGAIATSFERRLMSVESAYCRRYYNRFVDSLLNNYPMLMGVFFSATAGYCSVVSPTMRAAPTPSIALGSLRINTAGVTVSSITCQMGGPNLLLFAVAGTGFPSGGAFFLVGNSASPLTCIDLDAELP